MLHLRLIAPADLSPVVLELLVSHRAVTNVSTLPGAGHQPKGDLIMADVAREAASDVLSALRGLNLHEHGSIAVGGVDVSISAAADRAEAQAPGLGSDAVVWEDLESRLREDSTVSVVQVAFYAIATVLAGIAVLLDSAILVVGAMIVGPEYGALAGVSAGLTRRRWPVVRRSLLSLTVGFLVGIAVAIVSTWALAAAGLVQESMLLRERPQTGFIYAPDALSFVIAFLAGLAGMVALAAAKSGALLGVLVSVTTIPAAGNCAVAVAFATSTASSDGRQAFRDQALTSLEQLLLNSAGIVLAGMLVLFIHHRVWTRIGSARGRRTASVLLPTRSAQAAAGWQDRFDAVVVAAAIAAVAGVALQVLATSGPVHLVGGLLVAASWLAFVVDVVVMLAISPQPARWARSHAFELVLVVTTFPLWPLLAGQLLLLELLPALTVLESSKLAKLAKAAHAVRRGQSGKGEPLAALILLSAAVIGLLVLLR